MKLFLLHRRSGLVLLALAAGCTNRVTQGSGGSTGSTTSATTSVASTSATSPVTVSSSATTTNTTASSSSTGGMLGCVNPDGLIVAMNHLFAGDKDPNGTTSPTAWQQYGLNIDGVDTTTNFAGHCTPNSGAAPQQAFMNGNGGIDN